MTSSNNRFDPTVEVPEINYLIVIALWLHGQTTTDVSKQSTGRPAWLAPLLMRLAASELIDKPVTDYSDEIVSRQKCHEIITKASHRILSSLAKSYEQLFSLVLHNSEKLPEHLKQDKDLARVKELSDNLEQEAFWLQKDSPFKTRPLEKPDTQLLEQMAWEVVTREDGYDDLVAKKYRVPQLSGVFDPIAIYLAQDRFKRFRGYTRDKMTSHAAQLMISNAVITDMFSIPGGPERPAKSPADFTDDEKNEVRHVVAALGTKHVTQLLLAPDALLPDPSLIT